MLSKLTRDKNKINQNKYTNMFTKYILWKLKYERIVNKFILLELDRDKISNFIEFLSHTDYDSIFFRNLPFYKCVLFTDRICKINCIMTKNNFIIKLIYISDNTEKIIDLMDINKDDIELLKQINIIINDNIYHICKDYILEG